MTKHVDALQLKVAGMKESCKITLIDDDPISHLITSRILQRYTSCDVESFTDPLEALKTLKSRGADGGVNFPHYILLDIDMPMMDGWQFLEEYQALPAHIIDNCSVIMLSSSHHGKEIERARQYRVVKDFFSKPFTQSMIQKMAILGKPLD